MRATRLLAVIPLFIFASGELSAQDVEALGARFGTRPPASYFRELARDQNAFRFRRGRALAARTANPGGVLLRGGGALVPQLALGPRPNPVAGTFRIPILLGLFTDSPATAPFTAAQVDARYFADGPGTVRAYYDEVSMGRLTLLGDLSDWSRVPLTQAEVTGGESALVSAPFGAGGIGNFIYQLLSLQVGVDWGLYDNDGPDGSPNSGDDDGYVDALAVIHPTRGDECGGSGDRIWAHKWNLSSALSGVTFTTSTPSPTAPGGFVIVDDYFVQGVESCSGGGLNEIGVFTHETGHAFGLPDLYDTEPQDGSHAGVGSWDLMASGTWGCDDVTPSTPCHMGAWSKAALGWVDVTTLPDGVDLGTLVVRPVETSGTVYRVDANDGSGEYFLLENRQRIGSDATLFAEGLLIWHIDPDWLLGRWAANTVNAAPHRGVWLRQADGQDDLGRSRMPRGDSGDPFPGSSSNTEFHAASSPAAVSFQGSSTGLTIVDIQTVGDDVQLRLLTRRTAVSLATVGTTGPASFFSVDGAPVDPAASFFSSAPFEAHMVEAAAGELLSPGVRTPFSDWSDDPAAARSRTVITPLADTSLVAAYAGRQVQLAVPMTGGVNGVAPGTIQSAPPSADLWFDDGQGVTVQALPRSGFSFLAWTGGLAGQPNPTTVTLNGPVFGGADFLLTYGISSVTVDLSAATVQDLQFQVVNGIPPIAWSKVVGDLPEGLRLSGSGRVTGSAFETGQFTLTLEARDATGLTAQGTITLDVTEPQIPLERAAAFFLLTSPSLTPAEMAYLDRVGNGELGYDLGDFRAWVLSNPALALSSYASGPDGPRTIVLPMALGGEDGRR